MRAIALTWLILLGACPKEALDASKEPPPDELSDAGVGATPHEPCSIDEQCVLAGPTCCSCPAFAVNTDNPGRDTCNSIMCPLMDCPMNVRAACVNNSCEMVCRPLVCNGTCSLGFAADPDGCLTCDCVQPNSNGTGCNQDQDCEEVPADCCGCAHGGSDTAVPAGQADSYAQSLGCPTSPSCPNLNVCSPGVAPHCSQGACVLSSQSSLPPNACGRPDLPGCGNGQACVINADPSADQGGVGVCTTPP